jgi:putative phage-type endonuclease
MATVEERESWLSSRVGGLGGSDLPAILGLSAFKTPIEVWESKVHPESVPEIDKEILWFGNALEPIIRQRYAMVFGVDVVEPKDIGNYFPNSRRFKDQTIVTGRESWMLGTADGWIPSAVTGLEIKNVGRKNRDEWGDNDTDDMPAMYFTQSHWYCDVHGAKAWNVAPLFSGNTLGHYQVRFDQQLAKDMYEAARAFWFDFVVPKVEPPIDQTESYGRYLARKFSLNTGKILQPTPEIIKWTSEMKVADDAEKEAGERKQLANNHLRALLGDAQKCVTTMGTLGWVRPEEKEVTDFAAVGKKVGPLHPEVVKEFTATKQGAAYLRAWWKK